MQTIGWVATLCFAAMLSGCVGGPVQPDQPTPDQQQTIDVILQVASDDEALDAVVTQLAENSKKVLVGTGNQNPKYDEAASVIRDVRYDATRNAFIIVADTAVQDVKGLQGRTIRGVCRNPILHTLINKTRVIYIFDVHYRGKEINGEYKLGPKEFSTIVDHCG